MSRLRIVPGAPDSAVVVLADAATAAVAERAAGASGVRPWLAVDDAVRTCAGFGGPDSDGRDTALEDPNLIGLLEERLETVASCTLVDLWQRLLLASFGHGLPTEDVPEVSVGTDFVQTSSALVTAVRQTMGWVGLDGTVGVDPRVPALPQDHDSPLRDLMLQVVSVGLREDVLAVARFGRDDVGVERAARGLAALVDRAETLAPTYEHPDGPSLARAVDAAHPSLLGEAFRVRFGGDLGAPLEVVDEGDHLLLRFDGVTARRPYPISVHEIEIALELLDDPTIHPARTGELS